MNLDLNESVTNGSFPRYLILRDPLVIVIPLTVIYSIILVLGLLGNIITCIVIVKSRYLRTTTNLYLFSLAISDLLLLVSGLPVEMFLMWRHYPDVFGELFCIVRGLASEASANATVITITAFTVERYLAICRPFSIQKWQKNLFQVVRLIVFIWAVSLFLAVPQALQLGLVKVEIGPGVESEICSVKQQLMSHSFEIATLIFFFVPMAIITILYALIGMALRNASRDKESKLRLRKSLSSQKRETGQKRVLKMLVAVVVAFFICWAPFHAQRLFAVWGSYIGEPSEGTELVFLTLTYVSGVLYYLSTCINPILYHIMSLKFRHAFEEMVSRGCCSNGQTNRKQIIVEKSRTSRSSHSSRSVHGPFPMTDQLSHIQNNNSNFTSHKSPRQVAL